jgi:hypothetical protein
MRYRSYSPEDGGSGNAEGAREEAEYFQRVEEHFGQRRGGPLILSPKDWQLVQRWYEAGIPLPVVLRGINQAFDRFAASGPRPDRLNTLSYCAQHIETTWEEHRQTHAGSQESRDRRSAGEPSSAILHLREVALACRREVSEELPGEASRALEVAAAELERLAVRAEAGDLDAGSLDAAAKTLEAQLETALALAWQGLEGVPVKRRTDLQIPRFSPYAI